ncbi:protein FAR1-RELATED SEQUENCE 6 [Dendrobium catenatum]|uniref:protein FAR1-RELATED SEQUENCE 6 n=1 Tax=Dendrobium catenatum TaxID=906689 RepID=UPI0009F518E5|nr:protein FAR1-RELATED SEQUENCE 6 [Dendrobium catenatum]XP_020691797.1 protein FAR1-RELATED SEQUENCE 6 [Dendrobium catenatum]XP_028553715.1 protein FAR1-RELATED SEQUENCE 6 [Dendrobium catenatum]
MAEESPSGGHFERDLSVISVQDSSGGMSMLEPDQMMDNNSNDVEEVKGGNLNLIDVDDCKGKIQDVEDDGVPTVGMVFKTFEEVYDFYNQYARRVGFGTKIRRSWYSLDDGQCNKFMLTCCKEGKREYKNSERCSSYRLRLAARTDCQARIKVFKKYSDGMFHLTEVNLEHNHPVSPSMSRFFRSHKDLNDGAKKLPVMRGKGHRDISLGENEQEHSSIKARSSFLGKDDLEALQQFLARMQTNGTNFFHLMDLDEDGYLKNVFWADGRCKAAYQYYGDVVTFDTTYLTTNFETPLVSFVGVNHHGHLVLFGCGLISDRSVESYRWLFKSWLSCMSGSYPSAIITDHFKALQEAVAEIFPGSHHRLCLLNIMKQMQENLGAYPEYKTIKGMMKKVVCDSLRADEFEEEWKIMIEKYVLEDNEWLRSLYENRHSWVPAFVKETFWAGMSSTQHKENINSFFDGFIYPKTSLKQFICKYESTLKCKFEKEAQADRDSFHKSPQLISKFYMEDQLRKLYTVDMFKKFQEEVKAILYCIPSLVRVDGPVSIFEVKEPLRMKDGNQMENKNYEVTYTSNELEVRCICCSFQMTGILCRHTLSVLNFLEIYEIPAHYIVERWRKDYKNIHVLPCFSNDIGANGPAERYDNLYKHCLKFMDLGASSDGLYEYALKIISEATNELFASDPTSSDIQPRACNPFNDKRIIGNENEEIYDLSELRQRSQPLKKRKELAEKTVKNSKKKVPPRKPVVACQNDVLRMAPDTPQFDAHIWTQDNMSLADQVSPPNLSIGNHFGVQMSQQHVLDNQAGLRWSFQHIFQQAHTPDGPPGPWSG